MRSEYDLEENLIPGRLRGYRLWLIMGETLSPLHVRGPMWSPGRNQASCSLQYITDSVPHYAPDKDCSCGFYAKYDPDDLSMLLETRAMLQLVAGAVDATGRVIQGTKGFRAEKVEIVALCPVLAINTNNYFTNVRKMAMDYQVPFFSNIADLASKFPPDDVSDIVIKERLKQEQLLASAMHTTIKPDINSLPNMLASLGFNPPATIKPSFNFNAAIASSIQLQMDAFTKQMSSFTTVFNNTKFHWAD